MVSKADLDQVATILMSLHLDSGASDETPGDTMLIERDPGRHEGISLDQLAQAMKTVFDLQVAAHIGAGVIKISN
jgi:hypothetical protein